MLDRNKNRQEKKGNSLEGCRMLLSRFARFVWHHVLLQSAVIAFFLFLIVDILCYRSIPDSLVHMVIRPHLFLLNVLIVWVTLLPAMFLRRRYAYYITVSTLWLGFGIANCVMLTPGIRTTPLEANDFEMLFDDPLSLFDMVMKTGYLPLYAIILIALLILSAIAAIVLMWIKMPKVTRERPLFSVVSFVIAVTVLATTIFAFRATEILPAKFKNMKDAYREYGFAYCLPCTFFDRGMDLPDAYEKNGKGEIQKLQDAYMKEQTDESTARPNIIFLQLESFFNVNDLTSYQFNEDPIPFFNSLKQSFPCGYLTVPSIAAGTANTEFEVISGMALDFFGAAEYPYKTILREKVCESSAFALKDIGYTATAIHNHTATFYDRHLIYPMLGFDRFVSSEYMEKSSDKNPTGWVRDAVLTDEILNAMQTTAGADYVYTVSVQGHGNYPSSGIETGHGLVASPVSDADDAEVMQYQYYIGQLREMDNFLRALTEALASFDEEVVLVMYGDHLPGLEIEKTDFNKGQGGQFMTEYVVWSNYTLENTPTERKDIYAYQLVAYVLDMIDIHEGNVIRYHQGCSDGYSTIDDNKSYRDGLEILQYDILYGKQYVYADSNPYTKTEMSFGIFTPIVDEIVAGDGWFSILGEHFTPDTRVRVKGKTVERIAFISEEALVKDGQVELMVWLEEGEALESGDVITIYYEGQKGDVLDSFKMTFEEK